MKVTYEAKFRIDVGKAIPLVGEMMERLNAHAASLGCDEQLKAVSEFRMLTVTVDRVLTEQEQYQMKTMIEAEVVQGLSKYDVRLVSFCRQSGNVQQSVS